jgi:uncharacterized phage-associated protein
MCYNIIAVIRKLFRREAGMNKYLDAEKALEVIVYVSQKTHDLFHVVKTIYYADKMHLENYGRLITGDYYVAMEDGPVPSGAYDLIKYVRGDDYTYEEKIINARPEKAIRAKGNTVAPRREPNLDYLSESDRECLDIAIEKYAGMDGGKLWEIVHEEESYKKTERNKPISLRDIITLDLLNGKDVLEYLES